MQVNAINQNFTGKRDNINAFIHLDDNTLKQIAYNQTVDLKEEKRHKRVNRLLMASIPVVAGIAKAVATPQMFTKTARLEKLMQFGETTFKWAAAFGIIDLVAAGRNKLHEKSEKLNDFSQKHPFLSFAGLFGAGLLAVAGAYKGFGKLADKYGVKLVNKYDQLITDKLTKAGAKLDNSKILNKTAEAMKKFTDKVPEGIKKMTQGILNWSPVIIGFGAIAHSANYSNKKAREFQDNYTDLKEKQIRLTHARNRELEIQNDYLLTRENA